MPASLVGTVAFGASLFAALLWAAATDARTRRIPNASVAAVALLALAGHALRAWGAPVPLRYGLPACAAVATALLVACLAFEALWRRAHSGRAGMGMGDVKLMAACALVLGPWALPAVALACVAAVLVEGLRGRRTFAFGPYLCASFAVCFLYLAVCA